MTPELKGLQRSPDIETRREMDKLEVKAAKLIVDGMAEDLRQRRVRFYFSLSIIVILLILSAYLLVTFPYLGVPVSLASTVVVYALRASFLGIRQTSDNGLTQRLKSRIRHSAEEKLAEWLSPQPEEKRRSQR